MTSGFDCAGPHRPTGESRGARRPLRPPSAGAAGAGAALALVAQAVVEPTEQAPVLLGGRSTGGPGLDVVALAALGGLVAVGVRADAVAQLDGPAGPAAEQARPHADVDPVAEGKDGPLEVGRVHPRGKGRGGEHRGVLELGDPSVEGLIADEDRKERGGADAVSGGAGAARGHLDEGVGAALRRGAGQLVEASRAPQAFFGLGAVGLEEIVLEAVELARDDGTRDRVEGHLAQPHPAEAGLEEHVAGGLAVLLGGVGPVGVGQLLPVTQGPVEVLEAHLLGLGDEHRLVAGHGGLGALAPRRGDGLGLVEPDGPLTPGLGALGQMAQGPTEADAPPGGAARDTAPRGEPRRGRLGPIGRPLLARLEG